MEPQTHNNEPVQPVAATPEVPKVEEKKAEGEAAKQPAGDVSEYRVFAILGYILPFLFFLPLLDEKTKNVSYVRFHANQQLVLLAAYLIVYVASGFIFSGYMFGIMYTVVSLINLALFVLAIIGVVNAFKGEMKELPIVGQFKLLP